MSAAELLRGPIAIASASLPAIVLTGDEQVRPTIDAAIQRLRDADAPVVLILAEPVRSELAHGGMRSARPHRYVVDIPLAPHALLQPVVAAQAAYPFVASLARARGRDPDAPPHLRKITRTV